MSFEASLRKVRGKRKAAAWEGAVELACFPLVNFSDSWRSLLEAATKLGDHRRFERALAQIGGKLEPEIRRMLTDRNGPEAAPLVRILGEALHQDGREFCLGFEKSCPELWAAALEAMATTFPEEAELRLCAALKNISSRRDQRVFAVALIKCATPATLQLLRDLDLGADACLLDQLSLMDEVRFDSVLDFGQAALDSYRESNQIRWPLGIGDFHTALLHRYGAKVDLFLEKLCDFNVEWVQRDAICELARRGNARGLKLVRDRCLGDRVIAEVAVEVAFSLGNRVPFDWFARFFFTSDIDVCGTPANIIRRKILERLSACNDPRWNDLACQLAANDPNTAAQIRLQMTVEEVRELRTMLLAPQTKIRVRSIIRLGEMKDVVVLPWIASRIESDDDISREEYFAFIEAIRQFGSNDGIALIRKLMRRCGFGGFANDFAVETIDLLEE